MLVTTPETLQAILPGSQMRRHLKNVNLWLWMKCMIWHQANAEHNYRSHLNACNWLQAKNFNESDLSATIGNPQEIAKYLAGTRRKISIIEASAEKKLPLQRRKPLTHRERL